jgi:hypothetical protein
MSEPHQRVEDPAPTANAAGQRQRQKLPPWATQSTPLVFSLLVVFLAFFSFSYFQKHESSSVVSVLASSTTHIPISQDNTDVSYDSTMSSTEQT